MANSIFINPSVGGVPFTGQQLGPAANNIVAPPFSFSGDLTTGVGSSLAGNVDLVTGGVSRLNVNSANATISPSLFLGGNLTFSGGTNALTWTGNAALVGVAAGQVNLTNSAQTIGVGFDVATDATVKIRTRAQTGYATVDALGYKVSGAAGANFGPAGVVSLTVVNGLVTAAS